MDPRHKIPAIALLGLSCSDCTDRTGPGSDGLVGDWEAIEIDGKKFPLVMKDSGGEEGPSAEFRRGWELHVTADVGSTLAYFQEYGYGEVSNRIEYYSEAEIDDSEAPKYRLTMKGDLVHLGGEEPYTVSDSGYADSGIGSDTGYADTGYADTGYADTDTTGGTGGLDEDELAFDEFERELVDATRPIFADAMILDCELKAEELHCVRQIGAGDDGALKVWTFARIVDEE